MAGQLTQWPELHSEAHVTLLLPLPPKRWLCRQQPGRMAVAGAPWVAVAVAGVPWEACSHRWGTMTTVTVVADEGWIDGGLLMVWVRYWYGTSVPPGG